LQEAIVNLNLHPKCANPDCASAFRWLDGGKLFRFGPDAENSNTNEFPAQNAAVPPVEHLWLCEKCCAAFTLSVSAGNEVTLQQLHPELPAAHVSSELPAV
jgi:hypothetical protein